ncbi:MAG: hypothetical protein AAF570_19975, partial [Bacteroidota bacterium]
KIRKKSLLQYFFAEPLGHAFIFLETFPIGLLPLFCQACNFSIFILEDADDPSADILQNEYELIYENGKASMKLQ